MSQIDKQPPDFSGWNPFPHEANIYWNEEKGELVPLMEKRPGPGLYWWGTAKFYTYAANPDISGIELSAFGIKVVMKIWGFSEDSGKTLSALIDGVWHVINDNVGEDVDVMAEIVNGRIVKTEICLIRADKTVIGKTVLTI